MLTQLCLKLGVLLPAWAQVLLRKLQRFPCLALPDQLYHALLLQMEIQLMTLLQDLRCALLFLSANDQ